MPGTSRESGPYILIALSFRSAGEKTRHGIRNACEANQLSVVSTGGFPNMPWLHMCHTLLAGMRVGAESDRVALTPVSGNMAGVVRLPAQATLV